MIFKWQDFPRTDFSSVQSQQGVTLSPGSHEFPLQAVGSSHLQGWFLATSLAKEGSCQGWSHLQGWPHWIFTIRRHRESSLSIVKVCLESCQQGWASETCLIFALKKQLSKEWCLLLKVVLLWGAFSSSNPSAPQNPLFQFESLLCQPMHHSRLHQRFPLWNWTQKLMWDSSMRAGGCLDGTAWVGLSRAGAFSNRVEPSLLPPSLFFGRDRNFTGRMTTCIHISCPVIPSSCCSSCKGSKQRLCHASLEVMTIGLLVFMWL